MTFISRDVCCLLWNKFPQPFSVEFRPLTGTSAPVHKELPRGTFEFQQMWLLRAEIWKRCCDKNFCVIRQCAYEKDHQAIEFMINALDTTTLFSRLTEIYLGEKIKFTAKAPAN